MAKLPSILLVAMLALSLGTTAQAAGPAFYETALVTGDANDFAANSVLDLTDVFASEIRPYNPDQDTDKDLVVLRVEARGFADATHCLVRTTHTATAACHFRYDLHFRHAGTARHAFVVFAPPVDAPCCPVVSASHEVVFSKTTPSLLVLLDRASLGLYPGDTLDRLYVTSALVAGDQVQPADRAPGDNANQPYNQRPELSELFGTPYVLEGTFPFFHVDARSPTQMDSVGGEPVRFDFTITPVRDLQEYTIRIRFDQPPGWSITPSRGTTGSTPTGLLTGVLGGSAAEFSFTASPNDLIAEGTVVPLAMRLYSSSQGYAHVPVSVRITGPGIEHPDYVFRIVRAEPLAARTQNHLEFEVLDAAGAPRLGLPVEVWMWHDGRRLASVPALPNGNAYVAEYDFPTGGTWILEPRVSDLRPAPHGLFTVEVSKGGSMPAASLGALLLVLAAAALARRK